MGGKGWEEGIPSLGLLGRAKEQLQSGESFVIKGSGEAALAERSEPGLVGLLFGKQVITGWNVMEESDIGHEERNEWAPQGQGLGGVGRGPPVAGGKAVVVRAQRKASARRPTPLSPVKDLLIMI